jgi:hypothetical protein
MHQRRGVVTGLPSSQLIRLYSIISEINPFYRRHQFLVSASIFWNLGALNFWSSMSILNFWVYFICALSAYYNSIPAYGFFSCNLRALNLWSNTCRMAFQSYWKIQLNSMPLSIIFCIDLHSRSIFLNNPKRNIIPCRKSQLISMAWV